MARITCCVIFLLHLVNIINSEGEYSISAPGTIRPNSIYHVAVSIHKSAEPCTVKVEIAGNTTSIDQTVTVQPYSTELVQFDLPSLVKEDYKLKVEGISGIKFTNETNLSYEDKKYTVLIQTDKAMYKPGDVVKYRAFILDANTKPVKIEGDIHVSIQDGKQNKIKLDKKVALTKGVYSSELQLSSVPVLGNWEILVEVDGKSHTKTFEVAEYVLPKFEVTIDADKHVAYSDRTLRATVRAKYTYGKPIVGEAKISVYPTSGGFGYYPGSGYGQRKEKPNSSKTVPLNGKAHVEFDIAYEVKICAENGQRDVRIDAEVEEKLTGRKLNGTTTITIHLHKHKIETVKIPSTYTPGVPFEVKVKVAYQDGSPVQDTKNPVTIGYSQYYGQEKTNLTEHYLDKNGMVTFNMELPDTTDYQYSSVYASYLDLEQYIGGLSKQSERPASDGLEVNILTEKPKVNNDISVEIKHNKEMKYFNYQVVGRGDILESKVVEVPNRKYHVFKFPVTFAMTPMAKLYISFVQDGDFIFAEKTINFDEELLNFIKIDAPAKASPGEDVGITVTTNPDSYVGLLGVDQSVLLLKSGNDLSTSKVFGELRQFESKTPYSGYGYGYGYGRVPGRDAGLVTFTNAHYPHETYPPIMYEVRPMLAYDSMVAGAPGIPGPPGPPGASAFASGGQAGGKGPDYNHPIYMMPRGPGAPIMVAAMPASADTYSSATSSGLRPGVAGPSYNRMQEIPTRKDFPESWLWELDDTVEGFPRDSLFSRNFGTSDRANYKRSDTPVAVAFGAFGPGITTTPFPRTYPTTNKYLTTSISPERDFSHTQIAPITVRKEFPENWLWELYDNIDSEGRTTIHKKVPDTITSWVITGFSVDPVTGLGLTETPRKLQVFQPFFATTNLPYSVKRGEVISIPIIVFNYMDKDLDAEVTLDNSLDEFEFTEATNEVVEDPKHLLKRTKRVAVPSNTGQSVSFMIRPTKVGHITVKVTATTPLAGDAVQRLLLVEAEGVPEYVNKAILVDLREKDSQTETVKIEVPETAVPGSTRIEVSVVSDLLGPTVKNLDKLVRLPYGCGEQNMVNFVPNILVLKYLTNIHKLTPAIENQAKKFLETGYQQELTFKHPDGSYSAFGKSDSGGSTWLTAYVARSFRQATPYTLIEEDVIKSALGFLAKNQAANGSFPEVGVVLDKQHSSGSDKGVALTSFTLLAFLENAEQFPEYSEVINKASEYISKNTDSTTDIYAAAISAYTLQLAGHSSKDDLIQVLQTLATTEGDRKYWKLPGSDSQSRSSWYYRPRSVNVEITSYALLALLEAGHVSDSLPILKWLVAQRSENGGFESTQDTVVGLQALIKFAEKLATKDTNIQVQFSHELGQVDATVNDDTAVVLQSFEVPSSTKELTITASGSGIALLQVSYKYNVNGTGELPEFKLKPQVNSISNSDYLRLSVCTSFAPRDEGSTTSNMAVLEVAFPTGFTFDTDTTTSLETTDRVKKVETKNGDSVVVLYFDNLDATEICPTFDAHKTHRVAEQKPAAVVVYDYYDNSRQAREFYDAPASDLCDICEGSDCGESCSLSTTPGDAPES